MSSCLTCDFYRSGTCRFNAPDALTLSKTGCYWPSVDQDDWCGRHKCRVPSPYDSPVKHNTRFAKIIVESLRECSIDGVSADFLLPDEQNGKYVARISGEFDMVKVANRIRGF